MTSARLAARAIAIALALTCAASMSPPAAAAGPKSNAPSAPLQAARELFGEATKDEAAGRWAAALDKLHRVAEVKLTAGVRYHIALCEEHLGQTATALAHYTEAAQASLEEKNKEVQELLREPFLTELRTRAPALTIDAPGDVEAEVELDGQVLPASAWGSAVPVDPGMHRIEAHAPGRQPFATVVTVYERERAKITVLLPLLAVLASPPRAAVAPEAPRDSRAAPAEGRAGSSATRARPNRALAIATTAGAIALVGGGVAAFLVAGGKQSDAESACRALTSCDDRKAAVRTFDALALGAWVGGAALGAVAVVLWASPSRAHAESARVTIGPAALRFEGSF